MSKFIPLILSALILTACTGQIIAPPVPLADQALRPLTVKAETAETIPDEVIVKYRSGFSTQAIKPLNGGEVLDAFNTNEESTQLHRLKGNLKLEAAIKAYEADPSVEFAVPNVRYQVQMTLGERVKRFFKGSAATDETASPEPAQSPEVTPSPSPSASVSTRPVSGSRIAETIAALDPLSKDQWYLASLDMNQVWSEHGTGSSGVTVAVLDTGVDYTHPDLAGRIIKGPDYVDKDYDPKDEHGHGTHVAGIIAAGLNNEQGIAGLAPDVKVLAVRVLDAKGSGSLFNIAKGIAYAANNGAKVINLSLGSPPGGMIMRTLANFLAGYAERRGSLIVAAAGNSGSDIGYPAAASKFLSVGAVNEQKYLASFSNRGPELDIVAPGVNIMSTFPTYEVTANAAGLPKNYASLNGTSMATPMVAALAAMVLSQHPELTPAELRARLESSATDLGAIGRDELFGSGLINPGRALQD